MAISLDKEAVAPQNTSPARAQSRSAPPPLSRHALRPPPQPVQPVSAEPARSAAETLWNLPNTITMARAAVVPVLRVQEVEFRLARTDYTNAWWALQSSLDGRAWLTERETVTELVTTVTNLGEQKKFYRLKGRFHP